MESLSQYPEVPWKQGWALGTFTTQPEPGAISTAREAGWRCHLMPATGSFTTRFFYNGVLLQHRSRQVAEIIEAFSIAPGILLGTFTGEPPTLEIETPDSAVHLALNGSLFCLACGENAQEKAESALRLDFTALQDGEQRRRHFAGAFEHIPPRHRPALALAAENLLRKRRDAEGVFTGCWSEAAGFDRPAFSLNELYPLIQAWLLIDIETAEEFLKTAINLQDAHGDFPAWCEPGGRRSPVSPWPFMAQTAEAVWMKRQNPGLLKTLLPTLRKYLQGALRRFDPHRDHVPHWQSEAEALVPEAFGREKATPDLTAMLLCEIDALLRLYSHTELAETPSASMQEERKLLIKALTASFWNPEARAFVNTWRNGQLEYEPFFGSFLPLLWTGLDDEYRRTVLENFEETHSFPGSQDPGTWKHEKMDDSSHLPAIHQFMAFEALRRSDGNGLLLRLFTRRVREGFFTWFERQSVHAARETRRDTALDKAAYELGPVTASLVLTAQAELQRHTGPAPAPARLLQALRHRLGINRKDLWIILFMSGLMLAAHTCYRLPRGKIDADTALAEAKFLYSQGRLQDAMHICHQHPEHPLSQLLRANLLLFMENPAEASPLYKDLLLEESDRPAAVLGLAVSLHLSEEYEGAFRYYTWFIDYYAPAYPELKGLIENYRELAREEFQTLPRWRQTVSHALMSEL